MAKAEKLKLLQRAVSTTHRCVGLHIEARVRVGLQRQRRVSGSGSDYGDDVEVN